MPVGHGKAPSAPVNGAGSKASALASEAACASVAAQTVTTAFKSMLYILRIAEFNLHHLTANTKQSYTTKIDLIVETILESLSNLVVLLEVDEAKAVYDLCARLTWISRERLEADGKRGEEATLKGTSTAEGSAGHRRIFI